MTREGDSPSLQILCRDKDEQKKKIIIILKRNGNGDRVQECDKAKKTRTGCIYSSPPLRQFPTLAQQVR